MIKNFLFAIFLVGICSNIVFSQEANEQVEKYVYNLKQKLLLSDDQVKSITVVFDDLIKNLYKENIDSIKVIEETNKKIEAFLDRRQLMKFDVIKSDFWNRVLNKNQTNVNIEN